MRAGGRRAVAAALLGMVLFVIMGVQSPARAVTRLQQRPPENVAIAQVAVVRLVTQYYANVAQGAVTKQMPTTTFCTGLGAFIATTGDGHNTHTYVLTDARLVSPVMPCPSVVNQFIAANNVTPTSWQIESIDVYLNTSYTGFGPGQTGAFKLSLDPASLVTNGLTDAPVVLPLKASDEPTFDMPVIMIPATQPPPAQVLDLGDPKLRPYTADSITSDQLMNALTPLQSARATPPPLATPSPTPTTTVTATATAGATSVPTTPTLVPTPAPTTISLGAPVIDNNGNLAGMVVSDGAGLGTVGINAVTAAITAASAVSRPGKFSTQWRAALDVYYAASPTNPHDPKYAQAATLFKAIKTHYPAFHAVDAWLLAAQAGQSELGGGPATPAPSSPNTTDIIPGIPIHSKTGLALAALLVLAVAALALLIRAISVRREIIGKRDVPADDGAIERRATPDDLPASWRVTSLRPTVPLPTTYRASRLAIQAAGQTDPGVRRKANPNQDNILSLHGARLHAGQTEPFGLFVVADGMGGHQNGREASTRAVEVLADHLLQPLLDGGAMSEEATLDLLRKGVERANSEIHLRNARQHGDMGTTVTVALITGDIAHLANVGDSRIYHLQPGFPLRQVTVDHSVVAGLVAAGVIRPDDVYTHPKRNQIYRSLGEKETVEVDTFRLVLQPGDALLLCSDGLWEMVRDPRIEAMLRQESEPHAVVEQLVREANENGGVDNISAIIVRTLGDQVAPQQTGFHIYAGPPSLMGY